MAKLTKAQTSALQTVLRVIYCAENASKGSGYIPARESFGIDGTYSPDLPTALVERAGELLAGFIVRPSNPTTLADIAAGTYSAYGAERSSYSPRGVVK